MKILEKNSEVRSRNSEVALLGHRTIVTPRFCVLVTIVPSKLRNDRFLGGLSVTVLSITKDIFVYLVITIRCKRRVKNCKFQFDSSGSYIVSNFIVQSGA
jgi:hypothetical protein